MQATDDERPCTNYAATLPPRREPLVRCLERRRLLELTRRRSAQPRKHSVPQAKRLIQVLRQIRHKLEPRVLVALRPDLLLGLCARWFLVQLVDAVKVCLGRDAEAGAVVVDEGQGEGEVGPVGPVAVDLAAEEHADEDRLEEVSERVSYGGDHVCVR